ncbi:uncharacterized protein LOC143354893 isoform X2 [Halictus rubicundus]
MGRQLWLNSLGLDESTVPKEYVVCSDHFRSQDFDRCLTSTRLQPHAISYVQVLEDIRERKSVHVRMLSTDKCTSMSPQKIFHTLTKQEMRKQLARM